MEGLNKFDMAPLVSNKLVVTKSEGLKASDLAEKTFYLFGSGFYKGSPWAKVIKLIDAVNGKVKADLVYGADDASSNKLVGVIIIDNNISVEELSELNNRLEKLDASNLETCEQDDSLKVMLLDDFLRLAEDDVEKKNEINKAFELLDFAYSKGDFNGVKEELYKDGNVESFDEYITSVCSGESTVYDVSLRDASFFEIDFFAPLLVDVMKEYEVFFIKHNGLLVTDDGIHLAGCFEMADPAEFWNDQDRISDGRGNSVENLSWALDFLFPREADSNDEVKRFAELFKELVTGTAMRDTVSIKCKALFVSGFTPVGVFVNTRHLLKVSQSAGDRAIKYSYEAFDERGVFARIEDGKLTEFFGCAGDTSLYEKMMVSDEVTDISCNRYPEVREISAECLNLPGVKVMVLPESLEALPELGEGLFHQDLEEVYLQRDLYDRCCKDGSFEDIEKPKFYCY